MNTVAVAEAILYHYDTQRGKTYVLTDTVQIGNSTIFPFMVQVLFGYFAHMKYVLQFVPTSRQFPLFTTLMMN